jgi:bifunctional non-homologous end joining protein LigD
VIEVSNADRVVFPDVGKTKGDVVAYYERLGARILPHVEGRPLSIKRYPKGLAGKGFFRKNVPDHFPESIARFAVPRSPEATKMHKDDAPEMTVYPIVSAPEHFAYLANQGAIELHVPTARAPRVDVPDRIVIDLDPPPDALDLVRKMALVLRDFVGELGLTTVPVATGSKGYHLVAPIVPSLDGEVIGGAMQKLAALATAKHPDDLTIVFRVAKRGHRVFVDWLRNRTLATVVVPYSLRARPRASVACPLAWNEVATTAPDAFTMDDAARLIERPDTLAALAPVDAAPFVANVDAAFERAGITIETFDRFRS